VKIEVAEPVEEEPVQLSKEERKFVKEHMQEKVKELAERTDVQI